MPDRRSSFQSNDAQEERGHHLVSDIFLRGGRRRQGLANGPVQRSAVEWSGRLGRAGQSGLGMEGVCEQEGLTLGTFAEW
jgi:hypothetical protein